MRFYEIARIPVGDFGDKGTLAPMATPRGASDLPGRAGYKWAVQDTGDLKEIMIFDKGNLVAELDVKPTGDELGSYRVEAVSTDPDYRGKGLGLSLYGIALSLLRLPLRAGSTQTRHGQQMWLKLNQIPGVEIRGITSVPKNQYRSRPGDEIVKDTGRTVTFTFPVESGSRSMRSARPGTGIYSDSKASMIAQWRGAGSVEESWRGAVAGLAAAGALGLGAPDAEASKPKTPVTHTISDEVKQRIQSLLQEPHVKTLKAEAVAAGLRGAELAQFLAQTAHETGDFRRMSEVGKTFKQYDPQHSPARAKRLGNTRAGDGARYHGRGYIQLTGRENYRRAGQALGIPLETNPDLAARPDIAAKIAVWYWKERVQPRVNNFHDTAQVTKPINSGLKGLDKREQAFQAFLPAVVPPAKKKAPWFKI